MGKQSVVTVYDPQKGIEPCIIHLGIIRHFLYCYSNSINTCSPPRSSTHNTRIERMWVEVGSQFVRCWRAFFYQLECLHCLEHDNVNHLWLLHYLLLSMINDDCKAFQEEWNAHPISGEGHDQSPNVQYFSLLH